VSNNSTDDYFQLRRNPPTNYEPANLPAYIRNRLPADKSALIIDFGCGFGEMLRGIAMMGYTNLLGVEINDVAGEYCIKCGLNIVRSGDEIPGRNASLVIMSHVLEHIPKPNMVNVLSQIRSSLAPGGHLLVCVPNAQSTTGAYWAFEDFTHEFLFTSGSLYYVTKLAGFTDVKIIDADCTEGQAAPKAAIRKFLLWLYKLHYQFWNRVSGSNTHRPSEYVWSFEVKAFCGME
jgi:SAM-dependent methyltransferase